QGVSSFFPAWPDPNPTFLLRPTEGATSEGRARWGRDARRVGGRATRLLAKAATHEGAKKHPRAGLSQGGSGQHTAPGRFGPQRPARERGDLAGGSVRPYFRSSLL